MPSLNEPESTEQHEGLNPMQIAFLNFIYDLGAAGYGTGGMSTFSIIGEKGLEVGEYTALVERKLLTIHPTTGGIVHPDFL